MSWKNNPLFYAAALGVAIDVIAIGVYKYNFSAPFKQVWTALMSESSLLCSSSSTTCSSAAVHLSSSASFAAHDMLWPFTHGRASEHAYTHQMHL
eukprot:jgi/Chrzof1/5152/Cz15g13140.t1